MNFFEKNFLLGQKLGIDCRNFNEFLLKIGLNRNELIEITGMSERTIRRHCNQNTAPQWLYVVAYCASGHLLSPEWAGWRLSRDNGLIHHNSPACKHESIKPAQINNWFMLFAQNRTLTLKMNDLATENKRLKSKMFKVDYRRLVPENVIPLKTTHEKIYNQLKKEGKKNA